jgi:hypothetical protein
MPVIMIGQEWLILPLAHASRNELVAIVLSSPDRLELLPLHLFFFCHTQTVPLPHSVNKQSTIHRLESRRFSFYIFSRTRQERASRVVHHQLLQILPRHNHHLPFTHPHIFKMAPQDSFIDDDDDSWYVYAALHSLRTCASAS